MLSHPSSEGWNQQWFQAVASMDKMITVDMPKFGLGDSTSTRLIEEVVKATEDSGAVRHGAESFNYMFPQDFDASYLIVWDHFQNDGNIPWKNCGMNELLTFLRERREDGFIFPINPVWPARDRRWFEIYQELKDAEGFGVWFDAPLCQMIETIVEKYPDGFTTVHDGFTTVHSCENDDEAKYFHEVVEASSEYDIEHLDTEEQLDLALHRASKMNGKAVHREMGLGTGMSSAIRNRRWLKWFKNRKSLMCSVQSSVWNKK